VPAGVMWCECQRNQEESEMNATTVAVDLAKNVFVRPESRLSFCFTGGLFT